MRSARNKDYGNLQIIIIVIILLHFLLIFFAHNYFIPLLTSLSLIITLLLLCKFWINFIIPDENPVKNLSQIPTLLLDLFTGKNSILVIKNGKTQQDYFLLKKAPLIRSIYIHQNSAALTQQSSNDLRLLAPGFSSVQKDEKVILTFDLKMQQFIYGPLEGENPLNYKKSGESYTDFHARQLRAEKVKSQTKDGIILYPSFRVFYQLMSAAEQNSDDRWSSIYKAGNHLHNKNLCGEARDLINEQIGSDVTACWIAQISQMMLAEIYSTSGNKNLSAIIDSINQQLLNSSHIDSQKNGKKYITSNWTLPLLRIYLHDLTIQQTGPGKDD